MTTRTCKLMGIAIGNPAAPATIGVKFNGAEVFNGPVTTQASLDTDVTWENYTSFCSWSTDIEFGNSVTIEISVAGGEVELMPMMMNHRRPLVEAVFKDGVSWPSVVPEDPNTFISEIHNPDAFESKYGMPTYQAVNFLESVEVKTAEQYFSTFDKSKYSNLVIDGTAVDSNDLPNAARRPGWKHLKLQSGQTASYTVLLEEVNN